ncbi:MAG: hypothetical protein DPW18_16295 [Chloroflexi bacterium]|nr:hypothetical protein [Chloroflexota bacterium]MDL1940951.1 hypothetical protein [Chloroflexi bacterium CFX2]
MVNQMTRIQILAICASHYASTSDIAGFSSFANWAKHENLTGELKVILGKLGALRLLRQLNHVSDDAPQTPAISLIDKTVLLNNQPIGKVVTWYRTVMPQEAQARIAYESLLDRFLDYLATKKGISVLELNPVSVWTFIPREQDFELSNIWKDFIQVAFSRQELEKNFVLLMNSVKLTNRGFGGVEFPIVTQDVAEVQAAFYLATLEQRILFGSNDYKKAVKENDPEKKAAALRINRETYEKTIKKMAKDIPAEIFGRVRDLASLFNGLGRNQFSFGTVKARTGNPKAKNIKESIEDKVVKLAKAKPEAQILPLLQAEAENHFPRFAGDNQGDICYSCGRLIERAPAKKGQSKKTKMTANRFILTSPSQRLQSGIRQVEPVVCHSCSAISIIAPIKLTDSNLVVRLNFGADKGQSVQDYLRMMTLGELNLTAGRYMLIKCTEMVSEKGGKAPVSDKMGILQYALFKMTSIMPRDALRRVQVQLFDGDEQELPVRHLVWLSYLQEIFELGLTYFDKQKNTSKSNQEAFEAIRLVQKEEVVKAIYALICGNQEQVCQLTDRSYEKMRLLEELRKEHCKLLEEADMPEKAKMFRDVAAMTGLLDAFCDYVRSEAKKAGKDDKNEVTKLIEEVTDPYQFVYRASHNLSGTMATIFRSDDNYFCFDSARAMLVQLLGKEINKREGVSDKGTRSLKVYFDDVRNAYAALFESDYKSEKEQKDFTTELKLSLAAKFPEYFKKE